MLPVDALPVTVIVPCWRCADTIAQTIGSILQQTARPAEIILVDDASGDDGRTRAALQAQASRADAVTAIRLLFLDRNAGPGEARNAAWALATQPYIAFIDADDVWHPAKLELQFAWMQSRPQVALCGHGSTLLPHGPLPRPPGTLPAYRVTLGQNLVSNRFLTRTVMLRREVQARFAPRELVSHSEDLFLWMQLLGSGCECWRIEATLAYSLRPDGAPGSYSAALWRHECNELKVLRYMRNTGVLKVGAWAAGSAWSLLKYCRRVVQRLLRRL